LSGETRVKVGFREDGKPLVARTCGFRRSNGASNDGKSE